MKIKINSMDTESTPSDEEIRSHMNFDALVETARRRTASSRYKKMWIAVPVVLALLVWYGAKQQHLRVENNMYEHRNGGSAPDINNESLTDGIDSVGDGLKSKSIKANDVAEDRKENLVGSRTQSRGTSSEGREPVVQQFEGSVQKDEPRDVYIQAEPRDGYAELYAYFSNNIKYPETALSDSIEGVETVSFTIDEYGRPVDIGITKSLGVAFDAEAVRLIKEMPAWLPATLNGRPVASQLSLPLTFEIHRIKNK